MNPIREWINDVLDYARKRAVLNQVKRQLDERLFLFAIEIGRAKKLTPHERHVYAQTFRTAQIYLLLEDDLIADPPKFKPFKNVIKEPQEEWLLKEPVVKTELEHRLHHPLSDFEEPVLPPADRSSIIRHLKLASALCPRLLPADELPAIIDRLDHPLDRA